MNTRLLTHGLETLTRQCTACRNTLSLVDGFNRCSGHNRTGGWKATCKECELEGKVRTQRKSTMYKEISKQLVRSHSRLLDGALAKTPEVTDLSQLREMYPYFTEDQIIKMSRLNHKINVANDFLIEEQSAWLDPSSRPEGGIFYDEELFGKPFASEDEIKEEINAEVYGDDF